MKIIFPWITQASASSFPFVLAMPVKCIYVWPKHRERIWPMVRQPTFVGWAIIELYVTLDMWILLSVTLYLSTFIYNLNSSYFLHGMFWCHEDRLWNENILVSPDMASWVFDLVRLCFLAFFIGYVTKRWIINQKSFGWNNHGFNQPVSHALAPRTSYVKITINMTHSSFELTCENFVNV